VSRFDPSDRGGRGMERLERLRGVSDPLDEAVILLNYVVEVFDLQAWNYLSGVDEFQDEVDALQASEIRTAFIDNDPIWYGVRADSPLEEPPGRGRIPALIPHEIKGFAATIDSSVQICPLAFKLDVRPIHAPGSFSWSLHGLGICYDLRRVSDNPSAQRRVIHRDAP